MNKQELVAARKAVVTLTDQVIGASAMTLAMQGMEPEQFGAIVKEAVLANPDIVTAEPRSLARALRKCCRDTIIPDGDRGALVIFGNEVVAMPMVTGIQSMAVEDLEAEVRSGVVYEGDNVVITEGVGVEPKIIIESTGTDIFKSRTRENLIGAWCWIKLPFEEHPRIVTFSQDQIARARAASRARKGPWETWPERMAEKSCVKSAIWRLRYLAHVRKNGGRLLRVIEEDNQAEYGEVVVDIDYTETAPTQQNTEQTQQAEDQAATEAAKKAKAAERRRKAAEKKAQEAAKAAEAQAAAEQAETQQEEQPAQERQPITAEPFDPDADDGEFFPFGQETDDPTSL